MKRTINKKIIVALLSALVTVCMGFALLLSRSATQAHAETIISVSVYCGNDGKVIYRGFVDTSSGAVIFPDNFKTAVNNYIGSDKNVVYGFQSFDLSSDGSSVWGTLDQLGYTLFSGDKNIDIYLYLRDDVSIKLLDDDVEKGTLTVSYTTIIKDITLDDLNAVSGVTKSNYILKNFTPNGTDSTFPKAGVRSLSLEYGKDITVVFKNEDGSKTLITKHLAGGSIYDSRYDKEIQEAAKKEGYVLKGWCGVIGDDFIFNKIPVDAYSDMVLYAVYEENTNNTVTITFKDGETVLYTAEIETGDALTFADYPELEEKTKKAGYVFKGWLSEGGTLIEAGSLGTLNAYKDMTYTAVYGAEDAENYYVAEFFVEQKLVGRYLVKKGCDVIFTDYPEILSAQKKDGYTFKGWRKKGDEDGELLTEKYVYKIDDESEDIRLEAVFERQTNLQSTFSEWKIILGTAGILVAVMIVSSAFKKRR